MRHLHSRGVVFVIPCWGRQGVWDFQSPGRPCGRFGGIAQHQRDSSACVTGTVMACTCSRVQKCCSILDVQVIWKLWWQASLCGTHLTDCDRSELAQITTA